MPWEDRWSVPALEDLLEPLKAHHRRAFDTILEDLDARDDLDPTLVWFGASWRWTLRYDWSPKAKLLAQCNALCYLVPNPEGPVVTVPLPDELIDELPLKKLSRYSREAVLGSKSAVEVNWVTFTPSNQIEVQAIIDLIHRKIAWQMGEVPAK